MNLDDINVEKEPKIIFMGTPEFAVPVLEGLIENYKVRAIVTQPDRKRGKDGLLKTPIKEVGEKHNILVYQPEKIKMIANEIVELRPDLIITCAYGQILPIQILKCARLGCINVHASLLPKLRGGAPIHRAILNGYSKTGITIMYMDEQMDTGDIISQEEIEIKEDETTSSLHDRLSVLGRDLLLKTLPSILNGTNTRTKQDDSQATYGFNISKEDEKINFSKTKRNIYNQIRGLNAFPGAYCFFEGKRLKVWKSYITENFFPDLLDGQITKIYDDGFGVKVSNGEVVFTEVQIEGKSKMNAIDFVRGIQNKESFVGKILG